MPAAKCRTYTLKCTICYERFTATKCDHPSEQGHDYTTYKKISHLRARMTGLSVNCWHCDPEARLDFTSCRRSGSTASQYSRLRIKTSLVGRVVRRWSWRRMIPRRGFGCWRRRRQVTPQSEVDDAGSLSTTGTIDVWKLPRLFKRESRSEMS